MVALEDAVVVLEDSVVVLEDAVVVVLEDGAGLLERTKEHCSTAIQL